jgi:glycosyltransferase involved in cell wall biosynthesis
METLDSYRSFAADFSLQEISNPLISIIITHYDYAEHVKEAISSIINQTHNNWECVVVDDASEPAQRTKLATIVNSFGDDRVRLEQHATNKGQVPAFFTGMSKTTGDFVCLLDPDDRYAPTFLEESLAAHMNAGIMCPILSTEQILVTDRGVIGSGLRGDIGVAMARNIGKYFALDPPEKPRLLYIPATLRGWHWTSTSAMMFRRAALNYLKPIKSLAYNSCADGYLAQGAHMLGGTLFLPKGLLYRTVHSKNAWITDEIYSSFQNKQRPGVSQWAKVALADAVEAIRANGLPEIEQARVEKEIVARRRGIRRHIIRWRQSLSKRFASA